MRIAEVQAIPFRGPEIDLGAGSPWWCPTPLDVFLPDDPPPADGRRTFPAAMHRARAGRGRVQDVVVRVATDEGVEGYGMVGLGSPAAIGVVRHHLADLVEGHSPFDVELLWDLMFRATMNIGRKGLVLEAISAIDIALWDIMGKVTGQPVCNLLGGRTRRRIRAYASQLYATHDLDRLATEARHYVANGFGAVKMRFGYGPADGRRGMRANRELVRTVREAVGPDVDVMADAYMGWDVPYAIAMIRMIDEFELAWVEEPVIPEDLDGYARIRAAVHTPLSGGEHEATRFGYRDMIRAGAVDILQPDVNRMGGITEARKVWALAAAHQMPVIPHAPDPHNAHLIMAHMNSPLIEYFPRGDEYEMPYNHFATLFDGVPLAVEGHVEVPDRPGLGITPNAEAFDRYRA